MRTLCEFGLIQGLPQLSEQSKLPIWPWKNWATFTNLGSNQSLEERNFAGMCLISWTKEAWIELAKIVISRIISKILKNDNQKFQNFKVCHFFIDSITC